jgi:hypothetical protein
MKVRGPNPRGGASKKRRTRCGPFLLLSQVSSLGLIHAGELDVLERIDAPFVVSPDGQSNLIFPRDVVKRNY